MEYRISSGNGPEECEVAVTKLCHYLVRNYAAKITDSSDGCNIGTYRSVTLQCDEDLSEFEGSVLWVCKSSLRPGHKRKNWFIDFVVCAEREKTQFDESKVAYTSIHSGGKGGQNVNKVETGIRACYTPTGDSVVCMDERTQLANRRKALLRLRELIESRNTAQENEALNALRKKNIDIERGNASARFEGEEFRRVY